jgi:type II secretory pathway component PulJ
MVAMALTVILGLVAFMGQRYMGVVIARTTERINVRSNMSLVMDQVTKELRETTTVSGGVETGNDGGRANYGVTLPTFSSPWTRHLNDVIASSPVPGFLSPTQKYSFSAGPTNPILEFFTIDDS